MKQCNILNESWEVLRGFLPADLERSAKEQGAMRRSRGEVKSASVLLRLILLHVAGGLSLEQAAMRAGEHNLVKISAVGLLKRLRSSGPWLEWLTAKLVESLSSDWDKSAWRGRNIRVLDATDIQEPGPTGTDWCLHYSLRLPQLSCDFMELTGAHGGESLKRLPVNKGDIVVCDRAYSHREGVAQVMAQEADVVVRLNTGVFPLVDTLGRPINLARLIGKLKIGAIREWPVWFEWAGQRHRLRLCVLRKSEEAARRALRKAEKKALKHGNQIGADTLKLTAFVMVLTSLPDDWSAAQVLEIYRARWQIELCFKRLKQLLAAGHVPKTTDPSSRAWLQAKILTALLIEHTIHAARFFPPWGYRLPVGTPVAGVQGGQG
ncbi:MAG: IS4 family transposase [Opitutaceae bacterium]